MLPLCDMFSSGGECVVSGSWSQSQSEVGNEEHMQHQMFPVDGITLPMPPSSLTLLQERVMFKSIYSRIVKWKAEDLCLWEKNNDEE